MTTAAAAPASLSTDVRGREPQLAAPPNVWPEIAARDDFTNLLVLLRHAREGCWAFALYNHAAVREQVVQALTTLLAPLPVYQWTYSPHDPFPYSYLARMPEAARSERAIILLFDFERAGAEIWKTLDYNRELFSAHPHGLVFWVTPPGRGQAARQAPHFWAQRSGVFDFTVESPPALERVQPMVRWDISIDNLDETQRQLRLYQGLLEDLAGQADVPALFLGDLHLKVARLAYYVDQVPLARQHAQAARDIAVEQDAARLRADSIQALGDVHGRLDEYAEARARYAEAQPIYRAMGDRLGEANCIRALGDVHVQLAEYAEARARYEEAQPIYRAIGDRLGEANCIRALGDVHVMLAEYAEARARYAEAQPIYRAIGARLGEANCIKALGDVHVQLSEYAAARARYEEAQPIYRAIGARLGEANCIQALGDVSLEEGDEAAALAAYRGAFERYMALGLPNAAANAITAQATVYNRRKEYLLSLPLYSQAVELASDDPMWYRNRALCYINLKDAEHALADLETAARLQPDHPYLHARRGDVALLQGDFTAAAGHYAAFVEVLPRNPVGHFGLARALFGQRRVDEALASLRRSLELTYSRQEVIDRLDELTEMQADHPDLPGIEQGVTLLRERLASGRRTP